MLRLLLSVLGLLQVLRLLMLRLLLSMLGRLLMLRLLLSVLRLLRLLLSMLRFGFGVLFMLGLLFALRRVAKSSCSEKHEQEKCCVGTSQSFHRLCLTIQRRAWQGS